MKDYIVYIAQIGLIDLRLSNDVFKNAEFGSLWFQRNNSFLFKHTSEFSIVKFKEILLRNLYVFNFLDTYIANSGFVTISDESLFRLKCEGIESRTIILR